MLAFSLSTGEFAQTKEAASSETGLLKKSHRKSAVALKKEERRKALAHYAMGIIYDDRGKGPCQMGNR